MVGRNKTLSLLIMQLPHREQVRFLRFNVGVGESVDVHGGQVGAALDAHAQPAAGPLTRPLAVGGVDRGHVLQAQQQAASLLQTSLLLRLPLRTARRRRTTREE